MIIQQAYLTITFDRKFLIKIATCANSEHILPTQVRNYLSYRDLNLILKLKFFAWKLIKDRIPTRKNLKNIGMNINEDCPFYDGDVQDINIFSFNVLL